MSKDRDGWAYLDGRYWRDITREERVYCLHLYNRLQVRQNLESFFVALAESNIGPLPFATDGDWEVGYEVCLFRDLKHALGDLPSGFDDIEKIPWKRTFDLCLFANDTIIIIEAKAQQGFTSDMAQLGAFKDDKALVKRLKGVAAVYLIAVASADALKRMGETPHGIDFQISWKKLASIFGGAEADPILSRADEIFETGSTQYNDNGMKTGQSIVDAYRLNPTNCEIKWVGRRGVEAQVAKDAESGEWEAHLYQTNSKSLRRPSQNWLAVESFVATIDAHRLTAGT